MKFLLNTVYVLDRTREFLCMATQTVYQSGSFIVPTTKAFLFLRETLAGHNRVLL